MKAENTGKVAGGRAAVVCGVAVSVSAAGYFELVGSMEKSEAFGAREEKASRFSTPSRPRINTRF